MSFSTEERSGASAQQWSRRISSTQNSSSPEITIEFHSSPAFTLSSLPCTSLSPSPSLSVSLTLLLSLSDGSITGAMLRELLQPSLSGCVSSNVRVELSNLLTMQEKGKGEGRGKISPVPKWCPLGAIVSLISPGGSPCFFFFLVALDSDLPTEPYWGFLHGGSQAAVFSRKKKCQQNKEINKQINKHIRKAYFAAGAWIRTFRVPSAESEPYSQTLPGLVNLLKKKRKGVGENSPVLQKPLCIKKKKLICGSLCLCFRLEEPIYSLRLGRHWYLWL